MPKNCDEDTFVAFIDICGFKKLMKTKRKRANEALTLFYTYGYDLTKEESNNISRSSPLFQGIFVSDCGIMWIKNCENNRKSSLEIILGNIQKLNKNMIANDILLTASIAYGRFKYVPKPETSSLGKKFLYGDSYLDAYQDNESGSPRIKPGECRVISNEIISEILTNLDHDLYSPLKLLQKKNKTEKRHIYFYWMLNDLSDKDRFNKEYNNAYESRYASIKRLINQELSTNQRI